MRPSPNQTYPKPVLYKRDFVKRYAAGEFGNASPTWNDWESWSRDRGWRYGSLFHIRNRVAGGRTWYDVPWWRLEDEWIKARLEVPSRLLYISAMAPTDRTLLQGEVMLGAWGLCLRYTTVALPMRDALAAESRNINGCRAEMLLRHFLDAKSHEWLMYLLETYQDRSIYDGSVKLSTPGHVVEFSTYSVEWGTVPGYNTVFWEVRRY